jgi:hypothetical protein
LLACDFFEAVILSGAPMEQATEGAVVDACAGENLARSV